MLHLRHENGGLGLRKGSPDDPSMRSMSDSRSSVVRKAYRRNAGIFTTIGGVSNAGNHRQRSSVSSICRTRRASGTVSAAWCAPNAVRDEPVTLPKLRTPRTRSLSSVLSRRAAGASGPRSPSAASSRRRAVAPEYRSPGLIDLGPSGGKAVGPSSGASRRYFASGLRAGGSDGSAARWLPALQRYRRRPPACRRSRWIEIRARHGQIEAAGRGSTRP